MLRPLLAGATLGVVVSACSSPGLEGRVYRGDGVAFRIGALPPSWRSVDAAAGSIAFRDDASELTVLVNANCGKDADVPLTALTNHLFMTFTERERSSEETVPMDGREALHTVMRAKLDGVPKLFDVYVLKKDGCVYDFVAIASPDTFEGTRRSFESFVAGFHTPPGSEG